MHFRPLRWLLFVIVCASIGLALTASPAHAAGLLVNPPSGPAGTTFQIQGSGFGAGEGVQLWAQYPDGRTLQLGSAHADGSGAVRFQVSTNSSYPSGTYVVAVRGLSSGSIAYGKFSIGSPGSGKVVTGTASCQGRSFIVPGFTPGEHVAFTVQLPNGSSQTLGIATAGSGGSASFTLPLQLGMPTGKYVIYAQGLSSGRQTSDTLNFDGNTLSGSHCNMSLGGTTPPGYHPGPIPKNIVQYRGPGVYLNTNPNQLYYFGCNWKWVTMEGGVYFLVLGFHPHEQVKVSYEILAIQGMTFYSTISSDAYGNAALAVNTIPMRPGHYHWWFTSPSASYCGHYDH